MITWDPEYTWLVFSGQLISEKAMASLDCHDILWWWQIYMKLQRNMMMTLRPPKCIRPQKPIVSKCVFVQFLVIFQRSRWSWWCHWFLVDVSAQKRTTLCVEILKGMSFLRPIWIHMQLWLSYICVLIAIHDAALIDSIC